LPIARCFHRDGIEVRWKGLRGRLRTGRRAKQAGENQREFAA
jgi:hypothetical protein